MNDLVEVRARDCACPGTPHNEGDLVYLLPRLPMEGGMVAERQIEDVIDPTDPTGKKSLRRLEVLWAGTFVRHGAVAWNLLDQDEEGNLFPKPFDPEAILADWGLAREVVDKVQELYAEKVMDPFLKASGLDSDNGPTDSSTSRRRGPRPKSPAPSSRDTTEASPPSTP